METNWETRNLGDVNPRLREEAITEINARAQYPSLRLPNHLTTNKISRLIYTNSGNAILALASNAIHLLWKWQKNDRNPNGKATARVPPLLLQPTSGILMTNEITGTNPEEAVPCFALSKNDSYLMSASGGRISLFNMMTFATMTKVMPPPPAATFLAFYPEDNNIIAIGMDDSTILIYNVRAYEIVCKLEGHSRRITGLAFSQALCVLVSSGADAQLCVWSSDASNAWEKLMSRFLQVPPGRTPTALLDTRIQFCPDQIHFLAVNETQLAIYETMNLECVKQWVPREYSAPISDATFSCDSQLVYASFLDSTICIFSAANLQLRCRINPAAYLPAHVSSTLYPFVIATHPSEPNQFALGLTDGGVYVFEPPWEVNGMCKDLSRMSVSRMVTAPTNGASDSGTGEYLAFASISTQLQKGAFAGYVKEAYLHILSCERPVLKERFTYITELFPTLLLKTSVLEPYLHPSTFKSPPISICQLSGCNLCLFSAAKLQLRIQINPATYLPANVSSTIHPLVIAAQPSELNQFAWGLTDGGTYCCAFVLHVSGGIH